MLEIFLIWQLAKYIGNGVTKKGLKKGRYQVMAVLLWLIGEFTGALFGNLIFGDSVSLWVNYIFALMGAIVGAGTAFLVTTLLPNQASTENSINVEIERESSGMQKFGRSGWIPVLVILLAFFCMCIVFGVAVVIQM